MKIKLKLVRGFRTRQHTTRTLEYGRYAALEPPSVAPPGVPASHHPSSADSAASPAAGVAAAPATWSPERDREKSG